MCVSFARFPSLLFSVRHIVLSNRHVCVPLEVTFSFSDWIRREWLDQQNTNARFEKLQSGKIQENGTKRDPTMPDIRHVHIDLLTAGQHKHSTRREGMRALVRDICLCFGQFGSRGLL